MQGIGPHVGPMERHEHRRTVMTAVRPFAHLHCHTHFSLLDGVTRIPELVEQVKATGMNACATSKR